MPTDPNQNQTPIDPVTVGKLRPLDTTDPHPPTPSPSTGEGGKSDPTYWAIPPALKRKMTEVARGFRKTPTRSEAILWQALRRKQLDGRRFRRQQPLGSFVVDFFCGAERLIIEVDGPIHATQAEYDRHRQELLEALDLRVLRLPADLVERNLPEALTQIRAAFGSPPAARPAPPTPLPQGEREAEPIAHSSPAPPTPLPQGEWGAEPIACISPSPFLGEGAGG